MATAIVLRETGGPEVLKSESVVVGRPGAGELRIRQTAIGVNFHDVYVRSGLYQTLPLPGVPGIEAAGVIEEIGPGVSAFAIGDRIGYVTGHYGAYASERILPAGLAVRLPPDVSDQVAATVLLKGLTAEMLVREVRPIRPGDIVLVHAAAGNVGRLLCQLAQRLGATVIGTVGSEAKVAVAQRAGCAHTILYRQENFVERVREITSGRGVDIAYRTRSARIRSRARSIALLSGDTWSTSGSHPATSRRSRLPGWQPGPTALRGRSCSTTSRSAKTSSGWPQPYSMPLPKAC